MKIKGILIYPLLLTYFIITPSCAEDDLIIDPCVALSLAELALDGFK